MYIWCRHRSCRHITLHSSYGRTLLVPNHVRQETSIRWLSFVGIHERTFHEKMNRAMGGINFRVRILLCYVSHRRCCCRLLSSSTTGIHTLILQSYQLCNVTKDEHRAAKLSFFIRDSPFIFLRRHASICNCIGCALLLHLYIDMYCIQHPRPSTLHPEESSFEWS